MNSVNMKTIFVIRLFISIIITLIVLILIKSSTKFKTNFYKYIYEKNISFTYFNKLYDKYIGDTKVLNKVINTEPVFKEKLVYSKKEKYKDGVVLTVTNNYLVPIEESGIVVFIGDKDNYGNTVIIQRIDGIDEWYGNISNTNVKLYDYIEKGTMLGEANKKLYLVYKKNGKVLDYEKYIK